MSYLFGFKLIISRLLIGRAKKAAIGNTLIVIKLKIHDLSFI